MPRGWLARTKKPNQPVSPVDWLETAERELSDTRKGSSEGQSPRRSFFEPLAHGRRERFLHNIEAFHFFNPTNLCNMYN